MPKMKIRKGDEVIVISGKDKGKVGKVIKALPEEQRVIVEGVAVAKRHTKPSQANLKVVSLTNQCQFTSPMLWHTMQRTRKVPVSVTSLLTARRSAY